MPPPVQLGKFDFGDEDLVATHVMSALLFGAYLSRRTDFCQSRRNFNLPRRSLALRLLKPVPTRPV